jgi:hypothetical protein
MTVNVSGTVTKTAGNATVVGVGTAFLTELAVGMTLTLGGTTDANGAPQFDFGTITAIADNTHLTISPALTFSASGITLFRGRTDQEIAVFILSYYGLSSRFVYTPPFGGGFGDTIGGTGNFLGVIPFVPTWTWPMGTPGLDYLDQLDQACAAQDALLNYGVYKTFETVGGVLDKTIFRTLVTANPQRDPLDADFSLSEGVDLLRDLEVTHDPAQTVNAVRVAGGNPFSEEALSANFPVYIPGLPATPPPYLSASSPYLPPFLPNNPTTGYPTVLRDFSFPMIEKSVASDPWNGLTAEAKARQLLQDLNTEVVNLRGSTYRDDLFGPAQTVYVYAPTRVGVFQTMWLRSLDITMSEKRVFRQHLDLVVKN